MNDEINEQDRSDEIARRLGLAAVQLCTVEETCKLLRVSRWQVNDLINRRELSSVKIGRRRLVPLADLRAFLDRNLIGAVS
ncbi:helix-turn-helix domain-containing protein [Nocardioides sp.]|uniref:helix-turn-helix domain-containing protein n=1 Tax=Nocardioides sp. TaxID=35761 RepID=UPI002C595357|nr:helix-turn-helix domain-containing protein [Nocardioides sp.]HSX65947.1 helix-turn-helix domain-containing protein [Nocardioides sp.]